MKILSWNILANEWIDKKDYPMLREKLLERGDRFKKIIKHIIDICPDVMLLQEVMKSEYKYFVEIFRNKYFVTPITTINWTGYPKGESGNVTMIRSDKIHDIKFYNIDSMNFVKCRKESDKILLINIHLDDQSKDKRILQIKKILKITKSHKNVIIGGDFNEPYNKTKKLYKALSNNDFNPSVFETTYFIEKQMIIDNIFYKGFKLKNSEVNNQCGIRSSKGINCQLEKYGSDHFPVTAILELRW